MVKQCETRRRRRRRELDRRGEGKKEGGRRELGKRQTEKRSRYSIGLKKAFEYMNFESCFVCFGVQKRRVGSSKINRGADSQSGYRKKAAEETEIDASERATYEKGGGARGTHSTNNVRSQSPFVTRHGRRGGMSYVHCAIRVQIVSKTIGKEFLPFPQE